VRDEHCYRISSTSGFKFSDLEKFAPQPIKVMKSFKIWRSGLLYLAYFLKNFA
jgi:hypothetical protein